MASCATCLHKNVHPNVCSDCLGGTHFKPRKITNAQRIRAMSDEELAELLTAVAKHSADKLCESLKIVDVDLSNCDFGILYKTQLKWLKQSAEEGEA